MSKKLRWGILGVAKINDRLLPAFRQSSTSDLRAIASRSLEKAQLAARESGIPKAYGSYEQLLSDPEIDAIYNPLPNNLHDEWTRKAADAGKHILCEKPLTPTAAEARALVDYCRAKKVKLMDGFMWPHHPRTKMIRDLLDKGAIGKVQHVVSAFTFVMQPFDGKNIRLKPELAGGSLGDVGCYTVYGIRWAFGEEPVKVYATAKFEFGVDVEMHALLWFADGRTAKFDCGFKLPYRGWIEITGTDGVLCVPEMWLPPEPATFELFRDGKKEKISVPSNNQIVHMLDDFATAVFEDREPSPSPEEAVKSLRVMDALLKSAKEDKIVQV
jgi:predicted dehydrogenase